MIKQIVLVAIGGAAGSVLRYLTNVVVTKYFASIFPLATFITNVIGCFLIGLLVGSIEKHGLADSQLKWLLITGFCGGYTTFSAFGLENFSLFQSNNYGIAFAYIASSIIAGLFAVWLGLFVSQ